MIPHLESGHCERVDIPLWRGHLARPTNLGIAIICQYLLSNIFGRRQEFRRVASLLDDPRLPEIADGS